MNLILTPLIYSDNMICEPNWIASTTLVLSIVPWGTCRHCHSAPTLEGVHVGTYLPPSWFEPSEWSCGYSPGDTLKSQVVVIPRTNCDVAFTCNYFGIVWRKKESTSIFLLLVPLSTMSLLLENKPVLTYVIDYILIAHLYEDNIYCSRSSFEIYRHELLYYNPKTV